MSSYTELRRYYTEAPKIIQSRGSSSDSHTSRDSRDSTDPRYFPSTKSSMGYYGGSHSKVSEPKEPREHKYRAPDAEKKYVESKRRGDVEIVDHRQRIYDPAAPRSSDATSSHYKETQHRHSHKHSSRR